MTTAARKTKRSGKARRAARAKPAGAARAGGKPAAPGKRRGTDPQRVAAILAKLDEAYPAASCELRHENPFQLLVATILSAQCTDARVNQVTPGLFAKYPTPADFAYANPRDIEREIRSTGFYRNKAKSIIGASRAIVERHGGQVPRTMEEMLELPGVARKTANVVLGTAYGLATGVVVDTHVLRLARRLDLTSHTDPKKVEQDLMTIIPREKWILFSHQLIWHGRRVCAARKPRCAECNLEPLCDSRDKTV